MTRRWSVVSVVSAGRAGRFAALLGAGLLVGIGSAGSALAAPSDSSASSDSARSASHRSAGPAVRSAASVRRAGIGGPEPSSPHTVSAAARTRKPSRGPTNGPGVDVPSGSTPSGPPTVPAGTSYPVSINLVYGSGSEYWTPDAKAALQSAATSLGSYFQATSPTTIDLAVTGISQKGTTLASASTIFTGSGAGYYGTLIQRKIQAGQDANGTAADGTLVCNFSYPWAFGDTVSSSQYDFKAVAIHELTHAMGFISGSETPQNLDRNWATYDKFLSTKTGAAVIDSNYNVTKTNQGYWTGVNGGLYFNGPNAKAANGGQPVKLYTPTPWSTGSSINHLDPKTGQVMNPIYKTGPTTRVLSPIEVAMLRDLGYNVRDTPLFAAFAVVGLRLRRRKR